MRTVARNLKKKYFIKFLSLLILNYSLSLSLPPASLLSSVFSFSFFSFSASLIPSLLCRQAHRLRWCSPAKQRERELRRSWLDFVGCSGSGVGVLVTGVCGLRARQRFGGWGLWVLSFFVGFVGWVCDCARWVCIWGR